MNIFAIITLISAIVSALISIYALLFRKIKGALSFSALVLAASLYALGYTFELTGSSVEDFRFGLYIEYLGIPFIPFFWLVFTIQFVGKQKWINWKLITPLLSLSIITFVLNYTNEFHHLYYKDIRINDSGPFLIAILIKGPWYWVNIAYINIATLVGNLLLLEMLFKISPIYRRQVLIMVFGSLCPWIGHIIYQIGLGPHGIDISPVAISITGIVYAWGLFYFKIFDIFPIALENVFECMSDPVLILDNKNRIVDLNPSAKKLTNLYNDNSIGKSLDKDFDSFSETINVFLTGNNDTTLSFENNSHFYYVNISSIKNKKQKQLGHAIILNDITKQKLTENELRESERQLSELNAAKDKFFNIIAHDLRNPFNTILGLSDYLVNSIGNKEVEDVKRISSLINGAAINGYKLLENLLEWARSQIGRIDFNPQKIDINDLVTESINLVENLADSKKIKIKTQINDDLIVFVDIDMIETILRNLFTNAIKFTHKKGEILITALEENEMVKLSVKDNGIGISKENINKLFKIEYIQSTPGTEDEKGTGFGLLLCKEFIEKNNGKIWVESEEGKGSEFIINMPKALENYNKKLID